MENQNKPNFLCIGAQKAGTSWLFNIIRQRPDIWLPPVKELHFFDNNFIHENRRWTSWHIISSVKRLIWQYIKTWNKIDLEYFLYLAKLGSEDLFSKKWYENAFCRPNNQGKLLGDITPEYSCLPPEGILYVKDYLENIKIIYIIRDPLERAISQIRMNVNFSTSDNASKISSFTEDEWIEYVRDPSIQNRGDYKTYIPNWDKYIGEKNILYLPFGLIKNNPLLFMQQIESFLGLSSFSNYKNLNVPVWSSQKYAIPQNIVEYLNNTLTDQYDFLNTRFSKDFLNQIK